MKQLSAHGVAVAAAIVLSGCTAMTTITASQPNVTISVKDKISNQKAPASGEFAATTFGNYEFKATGADGKSLYGILPLKFNGGYLALDILFFAPAAFFNLREVHAMYEIDVQQGVVKFRQQPDAQWLETRPTAAEAERAKSYFGGR